MFNIDDTPNIFKQSFNSSVFKSNITNDNDDNIEIASNKYITTWNISLVNGFIICNFSQLILCFTPKTITHSATLNRITISCFDIIIETGVLNNLECY